MKKIIKDSIFFLLNLLYGRSFGVSILMYHSVGSQGAFFTVTPEHFEKHLIYIKKVGLPVLKVSELVTMFKKDTVPPRAVCFTFDDGYRDNYTAVFPLLKKYNVSATIFIPTALIGRSFMTSDGTTLPIMNTREIEEMTASGLVEFMPHSHTHPDLQKLSIEKYHEEIDQSKEVVERLTGGFARVFAYPKGRYTQEVVQYLKKNSWVAAVTVKPGLVKPDDDMFELPRNSVDSTTSFVQFRGKLTRAVEAYNRLI